MLAVTMSKVTSADISVLAMVLSSGSGFQCEVDGWLLGRGGNEGRYAGADIVVFLYVLSQRLFSFLE